MVREYNWRLKVRSYEADAWGQLSTSGMLRYLEQSAVDAAADAGYGGEFHRRYGSAWVIRRMTLLLGVPARPGDELEIRTWISHFAKVRGGREYRVTKVATGESVATGLAEWVYVNRQTLAPMQIPKELALNFATPGAPLGTYDPPHSLDSQLVLEVALERTAEWHEADSMGHVNNAVYADWLDSAALAALREAGWKTGERHARGEYYKLDYKRGVLPGERLLICTRVRGPVEGQCAVEQEITLEDGTPVMMASAVWTRDT